MTTNQRLLALTANMPCKQINLPADNDEPGAFFCEKEKMYVKPYLQRMYAGTTRDNKDLWLHRFLSSDSERHLHCHPFEFVTYMLNGNYTEERLNRATKEKESVYHGVINADIDSIEKFCGRLGHGIVDARPWTDHFIGDNGHGRRIDLYDWHRITHAAPETWTALIVDNGRLPYWAFKDDDGNLKPVEASARDWWKGFGARGSNAGDVL